MSRFSGLLSSKPQIPRANKIKVGACISDGRRLNTTPCEIRIIGKGHPTP